LIFEQDPNNPEEIGKGEAKQPTFFSLLPISPARSLARARKLKNINQGGAKFKM